MLTSFLIFGLLCCICFGIILTSKADLTDESTNCNCGLRNEHEITTRIVGGKPVKPREFPWRVAIVSVNLETGHAGLCGGTIVSDHWILSAAHCDKPKQNSEESSHFELRVHFNAVQNPMFGSQPFLRAHAFYDHPGFDNLTYENDIRLVFLKDPIQFSNTVSPICLPWNLTDLDLDGISVLASGWGTTKAVQPNQINTGQTSEDLMAVTLPILSSKKCREILPRVNDNMLCTYKTGHDTCQGDSGGSIDYEVKGHYNAIGITSNGNGCAGPFPGVYTKVTKYLTWIEEVTRIGFCKPS